MISSVIREHHWSPLLIDDLYLDDQDHMGLKYWYDDIEAMIKEQKK
jgi:hypothetical protein